MTTPSTLDYFTPLRVRRPASVTVLAIIGIIIGSVGTAVLVGALVEVLSGPPTGGWEADLRRGLMEIMLAPGCFAVALLASSIGALMLKFWARIAMIICAALWVVVLAALIGFTASITFEPILLAILLAALVYPLSVLMCMTSPNVAAAFRGHRRSS